MSQNDDLPDDQTLRDFAEACLANAEALRSDATLLLAAERFARAHAVAVLALEEAGKAVICWKTMQSRAAGDACSFRDFDKKIRQHSGKLEAIRTPLT